MRRSSTRTTGLILVAAMVAAMWVSEGLDSVLPANLDRYGIMPRTDDGLAGIPAAPFLHVGFGHLISNTLPFAAMGAVIALGGLGRILTVTLLVALVSGMGTWLIAGAGSVHLGASGLVFGYGTYLLARGFFERHLAHLAVGAAVGLLFGGALLGGLVPQEGISWQAHLFGAIGGVLAARLLARTARAPRGPGRPGMPTT
jgi:membrane associated rhomboid family serine protease